MTTPASKFLPGDLVVVHRRVVVETMTADGLAWVNKPVDELGIVVAVSAAGIATTMSDGVLGVPSATLYRVLQRDGRVWDRFGSELSVP